MRRVWRKAQQKVVKTFRSNNMIKAWEVFLIDENGEQVGKTDTKKALAMASEIGLDLVEVNPTAKPPVAKIMDFGQYKYEQDKAIHKQKQQQLKVETKAIRLSVRISIHDFNFRLAQAIKFLSKGNKLKIELLLKGRERQYPSKAVETINNFVSSLEKSENINIEKEQDLTRQGGRFTMILTNKIIQNPKIKTRPEASDIGVKNDKEK